ncbi:MAG: hypothetical protein A2017_14720 [Lentisphaerae bacterium GWF2_44_16]|nr:MAG: hypothetical protein A2017_14720 [Lentisphaerae bacterium GWF2_44_16]
MKTERNYEFRDRLNKVHKADRRDYNVTPGKNDIAVENGWSIIISKKASDVIINAAKDLQDYFFTSMNVSVLLKKAASVKEEKNCIVLATKKELPEFGPKLSVTRSYGIKVSSSNIIICGNEDRGAAQGSFYLEDIMNFREAPIVEKCDSVRCPVFSPRMTHSGWGIDCFPDAHLNAMAHSGMDAILVFAKGVDKTTAGYLDFNDLIRRAASFGLDVYFYSYLKSLKHPEEKGADEYYDSTYGALFKACPGAKGIVMVGESCEFPSKDTKNTTGKFYWEKPSDGIPSGKPSPGWWPCYDYPSWINMIKKSVRKYSPAADIVFWTYNWGWAPEKDRLDLIRSMPDDVSLLVTFEMFEQIKRENAVHTCVDYTISYVGPGEYFVSEAKEASKRKIRLYTMCNTGGMTWDFGVVPYIPVPWQWNKRCKALADANKKWNLTGLMECHHYGWIPSFVSEMVKWNYWSPSVNADEILEKIAVRDFGAKGAQYALKAWKEWSEAINYYIPTNEDQYGPFRIGPSYPFVFHPDISKTFGSRETPLPCAEHAHFGNAIVKTMYHPFEDKRYSPGPVRVDVEIKSLEKMLSLWKKGTEFLKKAVSLTPASKKEEAERMLCMGIFMQNTIQTVINIKNWWKLNQKLFVESKPSKLLRLLDEMVKLAEKEIKNTEDTIPAVEGDSRLGWEPSMEYMTDAAHLQWKIKHTRSVLDIEIKQYREALLQK